MPAQHALKEKLIHATEITSPTEATFRFLEKPLGFQGGKGHAGRFAQVQWGGENKSLDFDNTMPRRKKPVIEASTVMIPLTQMSGVDRIHRERK